MTGLRWSLGCLALTILLALAMVPAASGPLPEPLPWPAAPYAPVTPRVLPTVTPAPPLVRVAQTRAHVTATSVGTVTPTSIYLWIGTVTPTPDRAL